MVMHASLSSRITGYFGALFLVAMGILFSLWYFGLSQFGLIGASNQRLAEAMRNLEVKANLQHTLIADGIKARRGDILVFAENRVLSKQLANDDQALQQELERVFDRLQRAYPDRYQQLLVVDPANSRIRASSVAGDLGRTWHDPALLQRAAQPGATEMVEQLTGPEGVPALAIVRQIYAPDAAGYPNGKLVGILIAFVNLQHFIGEGFQEKLPTSNQHGTTLLFDRTGRILARFPGVSPKKEPFRLNPQVAAGFEGTLLETDANGNELVVVYRHLQLSGSQAWTLVHYASKNDALGELKGSANTLLIAGLLLTLAALALISLVARRLTRPLQALSGTARQLGAGDLSVRARACPRAGREITALSGAFNGMAESIQKAHHTLEAKVLARTAELARERDRTQGYLDIAGIMLMALDGDGRIAMINRKGTEILGQPESALIGVDWFENFIPAEQRNTVRQVFKRLMAGETQSLEHYENRITNALGQQLLLAWHNTLLRNAAGAVVGTLSSAEDITERKQAEAELRIAAIAFESQEGMFVTDAAWAILRVNHAFSDITGYSAEDAVGQTPQLLSSGRHDSAFYAAMKEKIQRSGTWQGEIWDRRKNGELFPAWLIITAVKADDGTVSHYVATLTDITARKAAQDEINNLAFYDPLTGLPNRRLLMDRLQQALSASSRHQREGALLFIDLDHFKDLNDTLGHDKGDLLLQQVTRRLLACVREGDTVARLGGDEFVVMLGDLSENTLEAATQAETVGEKILIALNQNYQLAGYEHRSSASIGVTLFGEHQESIDGPLKRADLAMYQAKAAGRNTLRFFAPEMQAAVTTRTALEADLREAVLKNQFILYYQAQIAGERQITGAEVLLRWQHPQRGMVSPAEFIALAEETGVILPLGQWVLESACSQLAIWAARAEMAHLTIAVNVSALQFHHRDFVSQVLAVLDRSAANPQRLKLELTESLLISNVEDVIAKMSALQAKGVGFSLDDFGTGYSSLSYLKRLPLDQLKIDRGFVRDILIDPNDAAIAKMIIALADSLGLEVIAEGVETLAQRDFLARQGCHAYQGFLFSRPLPLEEFEELATAGSMLVQRQLACSAT